jgi:tRNA pseudouridine13 synthase
LLVSGDLAAAGLRVGSEPEDFVVDEELVFEPDGIGDHVLVRMQKRRLTTRDLVRLVAQEAGVPERDVGSAGMKDKHAITTQWLSIPGRARAPESWSLPSDVRILESARHGRKLRTGQQRGNRFRLRFVELESGSLERARAIVERIEQRGLLNYFGDQRFGRGGENVDQALAWLRRGARSGGPRGRFFTKLYSSVLQSEIYNRYVSARVERGLETLLRGEVVRLQGSASVFVVEDVARELARLRARDIVLTGPLPGPKMKQASGEARDLEDRSLASLDLSAAELALLGRHAPGTRRDVVVFPEHVSLMSEPEALVVEVFLPSGSYATELIRELTQARGL